MIFDQNELQKLIKERGIKTTDDLSSFMNEFTKEVVETLYEGEMTDHLGHERIKENQMVQTLSEMVTAPKL